MPWVAPMSYPCALARLKPAWTRSQTAVHVLAWQIGGEDCQHRLFKNSDRTQVFFAVAEPFDPVGGKPLEMLERFQDSLPRKPIQAPGTAPDRICFRDASWNSR